MGEQLNRICFEQRISKRGKFSGYRGKTSLSEDFERGKKVSKASKGRAFEHEVREIFENAGFCVVRGAGSKGFFLNEKVDLVCTRETLETKKKVFLTIVGVQCKIRSK